MRHDEITCPGCGHERSDSWEASDEDEHDCERCGLKYLHVRETTVEYHTGPACPKCKADDKRGRDSVPMMRSEPGDIWRCWRCASRFKLAKGEGCSMQELPEVLRG